jgi:serine/threonine-protein kinase
MQAGRYAEACAKFRESQRLDSGIGTVLNLGRCYARQGKTASAWSAYGEAAALARAAGQLDREKVAQREIDALEPELSKVRIRVAPQASGAELRVLLDGKALDWKLWGSEIALDPGDHDVAATAPEHQGWSRRFHVQERTRETLDIPPLAPLASRWTTQHTVAVVEASIGVVALAVGGYLVASAHADYDAGGEYCTQNQCRQPGVDLRESAITKARFAGISFAVGGASLTGAGILWFSAPSLDSASARHRDSSPSRRAWSAGLGGSF